MKKYKAVYVILFAILLIMFITGGIPFGSILREEKGTAMDAGVATWIVLIYNLIIALIVLAVGIAISCIKDNKIRIKWLFPIGMLAFIITLVPVIKVIVVGGFSPNQYNEIYSSFVFTFYK
ncbi:MAG: hypothetical protein IKO10_02335 [Lachnospiraceae bacterium]|nr:hypothetical protein [Lachnospiraceae bacterium]